MGIIYGSVDQVPRVPSEFHEGYLAFMGSKYDQRASTIAKKAGRQLRVCPEMRLADKVRIIIDHACALLVLEHKPCREVLEYIEYALSVGTPVVARAPGVDAPIKRLIHWGVTGYHASGWKGLWAEVNLAASLNRHDVRRVSHTRIKSHVDAPAARLTRAA